MEKRTFKTLTACMLALSATAASCGTMGPAHIEPAGSIYAGVFGGGGSLTKTDVHQYGTAFYTEASGGPLAVNAFGRSDSTSTGMVGAHLGFTWPNLLGSYLPVTPAFELEGYYLGQPTIVAGVVNPTLRLPQHDFLASYPLEAGVFLVNGLLNVNKTWFGRLRPYVGLGIGSAAISISGASSYQLNPAEPGLNHYSHTDDKTFAFAAQPKVGLRFDFTAHTNMFVEYRYLYLSQTNYTFGSTIAPAHVETSPWLVSIKPQSYNMGTVGIEFDV